MKTINTFIWVFTVAVETWIEELPYIAEQLISLVLKSPCLEKIFHSFIRFFIRSIFCIWNSSWTSAMPVMPKGVLLEHTFWLRIGQKTVHTKQSKLSSELESKEIHFQYLYSFRDISPSLGLSYPALWSSGMCL